MQHDHDYKPHSHNELNECSKLWISVQSAIIHQMNWVNSCNGQARMTATLKPETTVFSGKFFQIPRDSLPNSVAHSGKIFHIL